MAGNSNITIQAIVDDAMSMGDLAPILASGGFSDQPALSICNDVMTAMLLGGPTGQIFNWKFNRINIPTIITISYQQDYFIPKVSNVGWIEHAWASDINQTSIPKAKVQMEVHRDLDVTYGQTGIPFKICWIPNSTCVTGTWGAVPLGPTAGNTQGQQNGIGPNASGQQNPGPGVIYTNPLGIPNQPINATTCITDPNGNFWTVTTFGTCGNTQPTWPTDLVYPTYQNPNVIPTTVTDGTVVWTAVDPNGQGFRLNPIPPQSGVVWSIQAVCQKRVPIFTSLGQTLDPVPDDYVSYFKAGFQAQCYRRSPDPKVRAKFPDEWKLWLDALDKAVRQGDREMDDYGFVPTQSIMSSGGDYIWWGPAYPWSYGNGG